MDYYDTTSIKNLEDVADFVGHLVFELGLSFDPEMEFTDEMFQDYPHGWSDPVELYSRLLRETIDVCKDAGVDIDSLGVGTMARAKNPRTVIDIYPGDLVRIRGDRELFIVESIDSKQKCLLKSVGDSNYTIKKKMEDLSSI